MKHLRFLLLAIMATMISAAALAQDITVSGTVTDVSGEPIIGASVVQKGTSNGSVTDLDGQFSFTAPQGSTIVVSYVGYAPQEVAPPPA